MHLTISWLKKKGYTAHSFRHSRHSFAIRLIEKNINIVYVNSEIIGSFKFGFY